MRPLKRNYVSKGKSARSFRKLSTRTKAANMSVNPMRGGWRL